VIWVWVTAPWLARTARALATAPAERPSALAMAVGDSACLGAVGEVGQHQLAQLAGPQPPGWWR
jgi:hypothetical protein